MTFTDSSTNTPTSWSWTFGDSNTSTAQNPSHTYASAGSYTVALKATNAYGNNTNTKNNYITVGNAPVANFSGTPTTGGAPLAVTFTDSSTNSPTAWSWTFGDSNSSTAQNPSHTYSAAGNYTVALTATNAYGNNTNTKNNYITVTGGGGQVTCYVTSDAVTQTGWGTVVSGALSDMNSDDSAYRVYQSDTADPLPDKGRCDFYHYFATGYTPSQVSKIHVDYKLKTNISGGGPGPGWDRDLHRHHRRHELYRRHQPARVHVHLPGLRYHRHLGQHLGNDQRHAST